MIYNQTHGKEKHALKTGSDSNSQDMVWLP